MNEQYSCSNREALSRALTVLYAVHMHCTVAYLALQLLANEHNLTPLDFTSAPYTHRSSFHYITHLKCTSKCMHSAKQQQ
jgi:hypothetical protein